jgi:hypothetical protein
VPNFRSKFEEKVWEHAKQYSEDIEYEPHYIPYQLKGSYLPDMRLPNGIYVEVKGYLDAAACRKMKAVKASNPHLEIRFCFMDLNGKRNKRAKLKNWQWADKYGFKYCEGTIPKEWFEEDPCGSDDD